MPRIWINDGLTQEATVQPKLRTDTGAIEPDPTQPPVKISFRPPLSSTLSKYLDDPPLMTTDAKITARHKFLVDHLTAWDIEDNTGKVAPITAESCSHVPGPYLTVIEEAIIEGSMKVRAVEKN